MSQDLTGFRSEVADWLKANFPAALKGQAAAIVEASSERDGLKGDALEWRKALAAAGYGAPTWPKEYGGQEGDGIYEYLLNEKLSGEGAPGIGKSTLSLELTGSQG